MYLALKSVGSLTISRYVVKTNVESFRTEITKDKAHNIGLLPTVTIKKITVSADLLLV